MNNEPQIRYPRTDQVAPDAMVFINGSDVIPDDNGNTYEIRNDITDFSVDLGVDSVPGSASFTIQLPDHSIRRFASTRYNSLQLMSEIEIYIKGRFPKEINGIKTYPYYPVFWGFITSVIENYSDGTHSLQVSCADILRWWEITLLNISPSVVSTVQTQMLKDASLSPNTKTYDAQGNFLGEYSRDNIIEKGKIQDLERLLQNTNMNIFQNVFADKSIAEILVSLSQITMIDMPQVQKQFENTFNATDKISHDIQSAMNENFQTMVYWNERFGQIGKALRIFGIENIKKEGINTTFNMVQDELVQVRPYNLDLAAPDRFESISKSKMDIANELKDAIQFEFYMDVTGEIIFKPPFYNFDVKDYPSCVIDSLDIITWNFNQNDAEITTRVDVTGQWVNGFNKGGEVIRASWIDWEKAKKFGFRSGRGEYHFTWLRTPQQCIIYAAAECARLNALARQGSVEIIGRPEIRLGYPVYIPSRDAYYYVKGITHSFTFGSSFTTSLQLVAERRKAKDANGNDIKLGVFRNVGEVTDYTQTTQGGSISGKNENDNYMKLLYNPCIIGKNEIPTIVEPNFTADRSHILSSKIGDWSSSSGIKLDEKADLTKEYQTTDENGYELIVPFLYGRNFKYQNDGKFADVSTIQIKDLLIKDDAAKAQSVLANRTDDYKLMINPQNIALTFDNKDASMLSIYDRSFRTNAKRAQTVDPTRSNHK
jgi:hypothetical protein